MSSDMTSIALPVSSMALQIYVAPVRQLRRRVGTIGLAISSEEEVWWVVAVAPSQVTVDPLLLTVPENKTEEVDAPDAGGGGFADGGGGFAEGSSGGMGGSC